MVTQAVSDLRVNDVLVSTAVEIEYGLDEYVSIHFCFNRRQSEVIRSSGGYGTGRQVQPSIMY
jgi:hypothetical protein